MNKRLRDAAILSHMGQCLPAVPYDPLMTLTDVVPRAVPWNQLAIHVCHKNVPNTQILYAINAQIVALCVVDEEEVRKNHSIPKLSCFFMDKLGFFIIEKCPLLAFQMISSCDTTLPMFLKRSPLAECLAFGKISKLLYILYLFCF